MLAYILDVILRISILAIKYTDNQHGDPSIGEITMYDATWFTFSDFLPRTLATVSFLLLLKRPSHSGGLEEVEPIEEANVDEVIYRSSITKAYRSNLSDETETTNTSIALSAMSRSDVDNDTGRKDAVTSNPMTQTELASTRIPEVIASARAIRHGNIPAVDASDDIESSFNDSKRVDVIARDSDRGMDSFRESQSFDENS